MYIVDSENFFLSKTTSYTNTCILKIGVNLYIPANEHLRIKIICHKIVM